MIRHNPALGIMREAGSQRAEQKACAGSWEGVGRKKHPEPAGDLGGGKAGESSLQEDLLLP
jgi:hypothetical protein